MSPRVVGVGKYLGVLLDLGTGTYEIWVMKASWTKLVVRPASNPFSPLSFTQEGEFAEIITTVQRLVKLNPKGQELVDLLYHKCRLDPKGQELVDLLYYNCSPYQCPERFLQFSMNLSHNFLYGPIGNVFTCLDSLKEIYLVFFFYWGNLACSYVVWIWAIGGYGGQWGTTSGKVTL
ncbi:hypothetical protein RJT34_18497 [Clitoria ternatea]|uniref:Uncharacterized protein n=1 Tax=Clitoria ternatea TaxID=43366 RepID=A0AAN9JAW9_CLITE